MGGRVTRGQRQQAVEEGNSGVLPSHWSLAVLSQSASPWPLSGTRSVAARFGTDYSSG